jgi:hypothetical protein
MRRTAILLFLGLILGLHPAPWVHAAPFQAILDSYGGDKRSPCPNGSTGFFYTYRDPATKHWWYCDPRGNRFFALSMEVANTFTNGAVFAKKINELYGRDGYRQCQAEISRIKSYGFNTVGVYSSTYFLPVPTTAGPGCPDKAPFLYLMAIGKSFGGNGAGINVKDLISVSPPAYNSYRGSSVPDVFDPKYGNLPAYTGPHGPWGTAAPLQDVRKLDSSPWLLGVSIDDTDQMWGTRGSGPNTQLPVTVWNVAVAPPLETYSARWNTLYSDPAVHSKIEWRNWLVASGTCTASGGSAIRKGNTVVMTFGNDSQLSNCLEQTWGANQWYPNPFTLNDYLTVRGCSDKSFDTMPGRAVVVSAHEVRSVSYAQPGADSTASGCTVTQGLGYDLQTLNAAWHSRYTTLDSSAQTIKSETVGTGDGQTTVFTKQLSHAPVDAFSMTLEVNGQAVAGDCPWFDSAQWALHDQRDCAADGNLPAGFGTFGGPPQTVARGRTPAGSDTLLVFSTDQFPRSGQLGVNSTVLRYKHKSDNTFGGIPRSGPESIDSMITLGMMVNGNVMMGPKTTINYKTGALTITFVEPPPAGAKITISYQAGGWPHFLTGGSGLLDEDSTNAWFPHEFYMSRLYSNPVPQPDADLDHFSEHYFQRYYETLATGVRQLLPHHLVFSNDWVGPYDRPSVLRQAGQYVDVLISGEGNSDEDVANNVYGLSGKPVQRYEIIVGQPDSSLARRPCEMYHGRVSNFPPWVCQPTQAARGQMYSTRMQESLASKGPDGFGYVIGWCWWQMADNPGQMQNFGIFSFLDNAYDGVQDRVAPSKDSAGFARGGEPGDFGNFLGPVTNANTFWLAPPYGPAGR